MCALRTRQQHRKDIPQTMTRKWSSIAVLAAIAAFAAINAGQAFATETLSFSPLSNKFPVHASVKGGSLTLTQEGEKTIVCSKSSGEAEITGHKTAKIKLTLSSCGSGFSTCNTHGAASGEIKTEALPVELVYVSKEKHEAGLDINYQTPPAEKGQLVSYECELLGSKQTGYGVRGSIVAPVTPVNTDVMTHKAKLAKNATYAWIQSPVSYETETGTSFKAFPEVALTSPNTYYEGSVTDELEITSLESQGPVEIKA
jgi:hypothetical protein